MFLHLIGGTRFFRDKRENGFESHLELYLSIILFYFILFHFILFIYLFIYFLPTKCFCKEFGLIDMEVT